MAPAIAPTPKPPRFDPDFTDLERLDRPELDDAPDTDRGDPPTLPSLEWEDDGESGVKPRR